MSKALSLKLNDQVFEETEKVIRQIRLPRNTYINRAVHFYNRLQKRYALKKQFKKEVDLLKLNPDPLIKELDQIDDLFE